MKHTIRRRLAPILVAMATLAALFTGAVATSTAAGAANISVCPGGSNGWFQAGPGATANCVIITHDTGSPFYTPTWIEINVDVHKGTLINRSVVNMWLPWADYNAVEYDKTFFWSGYYFYMRFTDRQSSFHTTGLNGGGIYGYQGAPNTRNQIWYAPNVWHTPGDLLVARANASGQPTLTLTSADLNVFIYGNQGGYAMKTDVSSDSWSLYGGTNYNDVRIRQI